MRFSRFMAAATLSAAMALTAFGQSSTTTTSTDNQAATTTENSGHHRHRGLNKDRMDKMAKELNLTADQQSKLKDMHKNFDDQRKAIKDDQSLNKDQKQAKMKDLREQMHSQMLGILTPEQQAKMKEMHAQNRGKRHHKKGRDNGNTESQPNPGL
jgi:Spy/CpxP family protein refolding chaperone